MILFTASSCTLFAKFKGFGYVQLNWKRSCVESLWPPRKINSILSSSLSSLPRRLICHDARAQQFQLSAVGTMISVWRAAHNRFIKVAAARHSLAATRLAVIVMLAIEKKKKEEEERKEEKRSKKRWGIARKRGLEKERVREKDKPRAIVFTRMFHLSVIVVIIVMLYVHRCLEPMVKPGWKSWRTIRILMMRDSSRKSKKIIVRIVHP